MHFLAGNTAGAVSGVVLNQFTAIKYASWEAEQRRLLQLRPAAMWREGGVQPFMKGIVPTVLRDTIFGGVFALSKEGCARLLNTRPPEGEGCRRSRGGGGATLPPPPSSPSSGGRPSVGRGRGHDLRAFLLPLE